MMMMTVMMMRVMMMMMMMVMMMMMMMVIWSRPCGAAVESLAFGPDAGLCGCFLLLFLRLQVHWSSPSRFTFSPAQWASPQLNGLYSVVYTMLLGTADRTMLVESSDELNGLHCIEPSPRQPGTFRPGCKA